MKPTHAYILFAVVFALMGCMTLNGDLGPDWVRFVAGSGWLILSGLACLMVEEWKGRQQP